nr:hypothetical protein CFP56_20005 [Quercus suber]
MLPTDEKIEIRVDAGDDGVPEIGDETSGANEIEGELFGDSRGRGSDDFFDSGFGKDGNVATGSKLLEGLKESFGLRRASLEQRSTRI